MRKIDKFLYFRCKFTETAVLHTKYLAAKLRGSKFFHIGATLQARYSFLEVNIGAVGSHVGGLVEFLFVELKRRKSHRLADVLAAPD